MFLYDNPHQSTRPLFCQLGSELRTSGNCFQGWMTVWLFVDLQWYETIQETDINNLWILKHLENLKKIEAIRNGTRHVSGLWIRLMPVSRFVLTFSGWHCRSLSVLPNRDGDCCLLRSVDTQLWESCTIFLGYFFCFIHLHSTHCRLGQSNNIWFNE